MDRREFLARLGALAAGAGAGLLLGRPGMAFAEASGSPDIAAVKGSDIAAMLDAALKPMGGIGRYVKKGAVVALKPNIGWDQSPETSANTNPALVSALVKRCLDAGARKVVVFDHSCDEEKASYRNSMIEKYARDAGAAIAPAAAKGYYQSVTIAGAKTIRNALVHEAIVEADVFINVPVLKNHGGAGMTCAMKNLMGIVWDRGTFHSQGLDSCIADICLFRKPDLNIVDAYQVMLSGGPRGTASSRYQASRLLLASADPVAVDAACAKVLGKLPADFRYIGMGVDRRIGRSDIDALRIERITL